MARQMPLDCSTLIRGFRSLQKRRQRKREQPKRVRKIDQSKFQQSGDRREQGSKQVKSRIII